jgi:hypothetical protein
VAGPGSGGGGAAEQRGRPRQAVGLVAEDPSQHVGRDALAGGEDRDAIGDLPSGVDRWVDHLRVEDAERGGDDRTGDLAHAPAAAREVGLQLRPNDAFRSG